MKAQTLALFCLLTGGLAIGRAQEVKLNLSGATGNTPPPAAFTDLQIVEEFGWFIGKRVGLTELTFTPAEITALLKGFAAAAEGRDSPYELEKIGPAMDEFMQKKQAAYLGKLKEQNTAANAAFFDQLKSNPAVVALPSGLRYEITQPGAGAYPKPSETVRVHYTGRLVDGSVFDSSLERGEPAEFGLDQVIPGWTEGIQKVNKGGKIKLYVPPDLAYGDDGRPGIPPGSTLIFEVELLDIKPAGAAGPRP